jgi:hypothetical protein
MAAVLGRELSSDEHVHHRNEIRSDCRPANLELLTKAEHCRRHFATGRTMVTLTCLVCGELFTRDVRRRNAKYCGRSCASRAAGLASARSRTGVLRDAV